MKGEIRVTTEVSVGGDVKLLVAVLKFEMVTQGLCIDPSVTYNERHFSLKPLIGEAAVEGREIVFKLKVGEYSGMIFLEFNIEESRLIVGRADSYTFDTKNTYVKVKKAEVINNL